MKSNACQKDLSNLWFLHVMNRMLFKLLDLNFWMFHIDLDWWYGYGCFPPFEDELPVFNIYDITSIFLREPTPKKFTYLVSMNVFIYNFLDRVPKGPYFLSNMHLIGVSTCIYNNKQQHIFEGQVLRVSSSGYLSISGLHGIHYYMIALSFLSNSCIMWYVVYHTLVFNEFS